MFRNPEGIGMPCPWVEAKRLSISRGNAMPPEPPADNARYTLPPPTILSAAKSASYSSRSPGELISNLACTNVRESDECIALKVGLLLLSFMGAVLGTNDFGIT